MCYFNQILLIIDNLDAPCIMNIFRAVNIYLFSPLILTLRLQSEFLSKQNYQFFVHFTDLTLF